MSIALKKIIIPTSIDTAMQQSLLPCYPCEGCGIMIGSVEGTVATLVSIAPAANQNSERGHDRFEIDPLFYIQTEKALKPGEQIIGFYHSHPDCPAVASETDRQFGLNWPGFVWVIYRIDGGQIQGLRSWIIDDETKHWVEMTVELKKEQ